jgi:hypothetical protein
MEGRAGSEEERDRRMNGWRYVERVGEREMQRDG